MRLTTRDLRSRKGRTPIAMLTAYDFPTARILDEAGADVLLVGDSLGMVVLGYPDTTGVTLDEVIHHTKAVCRGSQKAMVVADLPFLTYQISPEEAVRNAGRLIQEGGAQAVKLEGGRTIALTVQKLTQCGIPVVGHIGLTPQSIHQLGGYRIQGRTPEEAARLIDDAKALEEAGAFALVLECLPSSLAKLITEQISIPTIGIGAGPHCDGQVQVFHDLIGMSGEYLPRHARRYAEVGAEILSAASRYVEDVRNNRFLAENKEKIENLASREA
ncbi:MAG TPA: 3-methyl-2-oxobutanoate hydroxymethyltransferase [Chroococcales cyanobacterium]